MKTNFLQKDPFDRPGFAIGIVNPHQVALARLGRRAWDKHLAWHNSTAFDTWRREQSIRSCGRRITEATQRDYLGLKAHFLDLLGESGQALNTLLRAESEPARIAAFKLNRLLVGLRLNRAYAEKICFCKFGCSLAEASATLSEGRFLEARPSSGTCRNCGFRPICRAHFSSERL